MFSLVISKGIVTALEGQIEEHLKLFKQLFPDKYITPKHHYGIHIPTHIISLGPPIRASRFSFASPTHIISLGQPIRASRFSFASAHNHFKELAQKKNVRNLLVSLAKDNQKMECCNFISKELTPDSHPLFATEKKFGDKIYGR